MDGFVDAIQRGVLVFGSVARGEADRQSDIDVFVLVDGDRTTARQVVSSVVEALETNREPPLED